MPQDRENETVVVIDDDYVMRLSCSKILSKEGFTVETCEDGAKGLEAVARLKPELVLVDLKMPGISGMEVASRLHEINPLTVIIVITGYATVGTAVEAMKSGAYDFLPKPFSPDQLRMTANRALQHYRLVRESRKSEIEQELARRRFVSFVSHQLKSPLAAVHQYLQVMKHLGDSPEMTAKRSDWLERCLSRTEEMLELIQDWLTLARVESGCLTDRRVRLDVGTILINVLKSNGQLAEAKNVSMSFDIPEKVCFARGDRTCLTVLFDNLIVNAIKYNRQGGEVRVSAGTTAGEVWVEVKDTGPGIPEEVRSHLFDEFFRGGTSSGEKPAGTGLGLSICKKILSEMGGSIKVDSVVGEGSVFRVTMPAYRDESPEQNQGSAR